MKDGNMEGWRRNYITRQSWSRKATRWGPQSRLSPTTLHDNNIHIDISFTITLTLPFASAREQHQKRQAPKSRSTPNFVARAASRAMKRHQHWHQEQHKHRHLGSLHPLLSAIPVWTTAGRMWSECPSKEDNNKSRASLWCQRYLWQECLRDKKDREQERKIYRERKINNCSAFSSSSSSLASLNELTATRDNKNKKHWIWRATHWQHQDFSQHRLP